MQMMCCRTLEFSLLLVGAMSLSLGIPAECAFRYDIRKLMNSADTNLDRDDLMSRNQERNPEGCCQTFSTPSEMRPSSMQLGVIRIHGPPP